MPEKILLVVFDGLGDRPLRELEAQTPLEAAEKPNINRLARKGITGLMNTIGVGVMPGSDVAHFALLGFEPEKVYFGRGPLEALGIDYDLKKKDIALRLNFATVEKGVVKDRRAGRLADCSELCKALDGLVIEKVKFFVKPNSEHRAVLVLEGKNLSPKVSATDSKIVGVKVPAVKALDSSKQAAFTAKVLNKFFQQAAEILSTHPLNQRRQKQGFLAANHIIARGAGRLHDLESFEQKFGLKACCIAGGALYKGVAKSLGMKIIEVKGANGKQDTDLNAKIDHALQALQDFDFVFLHIKAADTFGEDGNYLGKKEFIEKADKALRSLPELQNTIIAITADHSTPCVLKSHSADPVPLLIFGPNIRIDPVTNFSERACAHGAMGRIKGVELVPELINLAGRSKIYGA
ncbi:MAG TPA: 2,3-bisphosphoglycerate-independent phosphoglycerate mutase [Candidatus Diapherotrites archaeon]|uniref:2,3-bisphosphoglycerate-independent phosphoglycerate mutase n=1 Tax=Candidatus Iainarchaeum sp. TaxID=3101447 RepID=A0A7J4JYK3_9ARCH|nr:2,3-bisphosphoglycerate-independent phosphoglycerate mutase [Candidatus Diapherotrites archaeon]